MKVRTRYAPSPTGFQHIGGIRTALYAYLFAKKHNGTLILRIEDTDQKRFVEGAENYINESLNWLGIQPDESTEVGGDFGPYRQSERKHIYKQYADLLIKNGGAYYAFDTPDELNEKRTEAEKQGKSFLYNAGTRMQMRNSLTLSDAESQKLLDEGGTYTIRLKTPENEDVSFYDVVREKVTFNSAQIDDKVIFKADGMPTYHLANVVDDHLMEVTHVIRGEEWLSSTPLHVLLYRYLGWEDTIPTFAHLPLLLNPGGKGKLSKRHGDKLGFPVFPLAWEHPVKNESSNGYREMGFLPDAFVNFLAMLGWNPGTEQEIFDMEGLIEAFSLERVIKSGAKFDFDKAKWFNQQFLMQKSGNELADLVLNDKNEDDFDKNKIAHIADMLKERMTFVSDFWEVGSYFFSPPTEYDRKTVRKKWNETNIPHFHTLKEKLSEISEFNATNIETCIKSYIEESGLGFGDILLPFRLMITGVKGGPSAFEIAEILGKNEVLSRMEIAFVKWEEMTKES